MSRSRHAAIYADVSRRADYPLSKSRFALFNSGLVPADRYRRDLRFYEECVAESLRIDVGWGAEWMAHTADEYRSNGRLDAGFRRLDDIGRLLAGAGVRPYWSYCYVPAEYRPEGGDWRDMADVDGWVQMVGEYARSAREAGIGVGYHEVYNEPDLRDERTAEPVFFSGDMADYLNIYRKASVAIRQADPDVPVGGPALALVLPNSGWIAPFLATVAEEQLPLDFFSFHHYGTFSVRSAVAKVVSEFGGRPELAEVELHLNEYNSFPVDYPRGGPQDSYLLAAALLEDIDRLLAMPALTKVSWAQFQDSGHGNFSGMIDIDGHPKPVWFAYRAYQRMPVDRVPTVVDGPAGVAGIAGYEAGRAQMLIWNRSATDVTVEAGFASWVGPIATAEAVHINAENNGDRPEPLATTGGPKWTLSVPRGGVVCVNLSSDVSPPVAAPAGHISRLRRRYGDRDARAWADLDERSNSFRFGTAEHPDDVPELGATLHDTADAIVVTTEICDAGGTPTPHGALELRIESGSIRHEFRFGMPAGDVEDDWPSWVDTATPVDAQDAPIGRTVLDRVALGLDSTMTVTARLRGAPPGTFAQLRLADAAAEVGGDPNGA